MEYPKQYKSPNTAMILAAGKGMRLMPITADIPKAMVEVAGEKIIDRSIKSLIDFGIKKIVVNTHYKADILEAHLEKKYEKSDVEILISREDEILETGGGILNAMNKFNLNELIVMNCDVVFDKGHSSILNALSKKWEERADFVGALYPFTKTDKEKGDFNIMGDTISNIGENKEFIFAGCYFLKKKIFGDMKVEKFSMTKILFNIENLPFIFKAVEIKGVEWFDIGTPQTLKIANNFFKR